MNSGEFLALVTVILLAAFQTAFAIQAPATLYQRAGFEGGKKAIFGLDRIGACRALPDFNDQTASIDLVPGYCVRLWGAGCDNRGYPNIDLSSDSAERLDISSYGFTGGNGVSAISRIACPIVSDVPILYTGPGQTEIGRAHV